MMLQSDGEEGKSVEKALQFLREYDQPIEDLEQLDDLPNIDEDIRKQITEKMGTREESS